MHLTRSRHGRWQIARTLYEHLIEPDRHTGLSHGHYRWAGPLSGAAKSQVRCCCGLAGDREDQVVHLRNLMDVGVAQVRLHFATGAILISAEVRP